MSLLEGKTTMSVPYILDAEGYIGRECPKCERYFKVKPGTGIPDNSDIRCPYCSHVGSTKEYFTKDQINYGKSVAMNAYSKKILGELKKIECEPKKGAFLSLGISVKGQPPQITPYQEKDLAAKITCENCTLEYAIEGNTGHCPDCGTLVTVA